MAEWIGELVRAFLGAGLGAAAVQIGITLWKERVKRRADATYLALRLAVGLEAFAYECLDLVADNRSAEPPPGSPYPQWKTALPPLKDYPEDSDAWKAIDLALASACLNFRTAVAASQAGIRYDTDHAEADIHHVVGGEACRIGTEAYEIAERLRERYKLPRHKGLYDVANGLADAAGEFEDEDARRASTR